MPIIIWAFANQDTLVHGGHFNWQLDEQTEAVVWLKLMLAGHAALMIATKHDWDQISQQVFAAVLQLA